MKTRPALTALLISLVLITALAPAALARGELVAEPGRIDFGSVSVNCETVDSGPKADCPTRVVTLTNTSQSTLALNGFASCGRIIGPNPTCETSGRFPGWGGLVVEDDAEFECFTPLAPGASCSVTLIADPDVRRPIHGYLAIWGGLDEELVLRVPVSVRGT